MSAIFYQVFLTITLLSLSVLSCDSFVLNDDNVLVGDRLYSISEDKYFEISDSVGHHLILLTKEGRESHILSPKSISGENGKVTVRLDIEDLAIHSTTPQTSTKKGGTTCWWKNNQVQVEEKLPQALWNSANEVLSVEVDSNTNKLVIEFRETCELARYSLKFLDTTKVKGKEKFYFSIARDANAPGICSEDFSQTVRLVADIPYEISKNKAGLVIVGAKNSMAETSPR